ncbi:hypothetical protein GW17_00007899, partial [Ensete ventricosum]
MLCSVPLVAAVTGEVKRIPSDPKELSMDGGFVVPDANSFGQTFRCNLTECRQKNIFLVKRMREEYGKLDRVEMSIWECIELLNEFVDESDPDLDEPQIEHLLQTAEAIRKDYPDEDWLHLTGLIHGLLNSIKLQSFYCLCQIIACHFPNLAPLMSIYAFEIVLLIKYDLYSKSKVRIDVEKVKPYYLSLIEK